MIRAFLKRLLRPAPTELDPSLWSPSGWSSAVQEPESHNVVTLRQPEPVTTPEKKAA